MTRILLIGYDPQAVDYSDPGLPPGLDVQKITAGIELGLMQIRDRGWDAEFCPILPDESAATTVSKQLSSASYDCVVIGGGVRGSSTGLTVFEAVINAVHEGAPSAAIAFNRLPDDTAEAAARWIR